MKKKLTSICSWALALLLASIAGGCSSASKAARTPKNTAVEEAKDSVATDTEAVEKPIRHPGEMMLMYGVRPVDFQKVDE